MNASYQQLANPPNLMSLYLQMQQKQQVEAGFNSGLALIAANHSPPSMRNAIMQSLTGGQGDAGTTVNNLMSLYGAQNQMAAQQQLLAQAPAIAQKLNMDEGVVRAQIMAGRGDELVKSMEPGEQQKNILFMHDQYINNGGNEADWRKNVLPTVMMGSLPGMTPDYMSYMKEAQDWPQTHPGQPTPDFVQQNITYLIGPGTVFPAFHSQQLIGQGSNPDQLTSGSSIFFQTGSSPAHIL